MNLRIENNAFLSLFLIFTLLLSCSINLETVSANDILKCDKCITFLAKYKSISAPLMTFDEYSKLMDSEALISTTAPQEKQKANILTAETYEEISENLFCFMGMSKLDIEKRFDNTFKKISGQIKEPDATWLTDLTFNLGRYSKSKEGETLVIYPGERIVFEYAFLNGDTLYQGVYGDTLKLKNCLEAAGINFKGNIRE